MTVHVCPDCRQQFPRSYNLQRHRQRRACLKPAVQGWRPGGTTGDRRLDVAIGRFIYWPHPLPCDYDTEEDDAA